MTTQIKVETYLNYTNGEWKPSISGEVEKSINPANKNEIVGYVQKSTTEDLQELIQASKEAQVHWRNLSGQARGAFLYKAADIMESRLEEIAETLTREMGKTLPEAKGETARGVAILRYYAGEGMRKIGDVIPASDSEALMFTSRVPVGVVGVITPWNFPVAIPVWKMAPALIYGNSVVLKPAREASVTAAKVIECFADAGLPAGVINLITGPGSVIGKGIIDHPDINAITFTGSDSIGKEVAIGAVSRGAKFQLEMGGKNPVIVTADADLDKAVDATINGGLRSTGQKCTATSRVIVEREIYQAFKEKLVEKVKELTVGDGLQEGIWMGPCVSDGQLDTVLSYIEKGKAEGATLLCGGQKVEKPGLENGFFIEPAVFDHVKPSMAIAQEEIFGPVLALIEVDSFTEAVAIANDVQYGLSASIFTKDIGNILGFIKNIEAGMIRVNEETAGVELQAPFGGMKQSSSHSREQGQAAIEFYTTIKTIYIKP